MAVCVCVCVNYLNINYILLQKGCFMNGKKKSLTKIHRKTGFSGCYLNKLCKYHGLLRLV